MGIRDRVIEVRKMRLGDCVPHEGNWRKHPDAQKKGYKASAEKVGFTGTLLARLLPDGRIKLIDGHMRQGVHPDLVAHVAITDLTEAEANAILATYDPLAGMADTDGEQLEALLREVNATFGDLEGLLAEVAEQYEVSLTDDEPASDPGAQLDRAEELREQWGVERGQLWVIASVTGKGEHRLLCGDSTNVEEVARVMGEAKAQVVFTSPPYAMQRKDQYGGIPADAYVDWWSHIQSNVRAVLSKDGTFFINIKPHVDDSGERSLYVFDLVLAMRRRWEWAFIDEFCWLGRGMPGKYSYRFKNAFEPIYQFAIHHKGFKFRPDAVTVHSDAVVKARGKGAGNPNWTDLQGNSDAVWFRDRYTQGDAYPSNVLKAWSNQESLGHPAAFAVQLVDFFVNAYSDFDDIFYEPFGGSGTTMVACEQLGRQCRMIELEPKYCAVILQRMADMGLKPELA